jgi:hypothetical protein
MLNLQKNLTYLDQRQCMYMLKTLYAHEACTSELMQYQHPWNAR